MRIIYLLGSIAGVYLALIAAQFIFDSIGIPIDLTAASGTDQVIKYLFVLICAYLFTTLVWRQSVIGFNLLYLHNWRKALNGFSFCVGLTVIVAVLWYMLVLGAGGARWSSVTWAQTDARALVKTFIACLIAIILATTEEGIFRGLIFKFLLSSNAGWAIFRASLVSSVIFALAHHFDEPLMWLAINEVGLLIGITLLGCLFALVYYVTNSLACSIGVHTGLIWIALLKKTQIVQLVPSGWKISNSLDPRTELVTWILFILLIALFWSLRRWMKTKFAIENLDLGADAPPFPQRKIDAAERPDDDHSVTRRG